MNYDTLLQEKKSARSDLSEDEVMKKSEGIVNTLTSLPIFSKSKTIMTYVSYLKEVNTRELIKDLIQSDKEIVVPYMSNGQIQTAYLNQWNDLLIEDGKIPEPKPAKRPRVALEKIDLIIVPGLVFDKQGNRLGYGHGNYDSFLAHFIEKSKDARPYFVGLAYDVQIVDYIKPKKRDIPMDIVVAETKIYQHKHA